MTINRRTTLGGLAGMASLAAGANATEPTMPEGPGGLVGALSAQEGDLAEAAVDFGHIIRKAPRAVLKPGSSADIAALVRWAGARGLKVAARGEGHSTYGRAMTDGGIVVDMRKLAEIYWSGDDSLVVGAGATWHDVLATSLTKGLTPPVLTNYLRLSVGGTLAVGGIGGTTSALGMQTDNVLELEVVTGNGETLVCSPTRNADLFDAVRAGLGQCGIITRATLRLVRAPDRVLRVQLPCSDLAALTSAMRRALDDGRFDELQGAIVPQPSGGWRYLLEGARHFSGGSPPDRQALLSGLSDGGGPGAEVADLAYADHAHALAKLEGALRSNGQWFTPHAWWLTLVPGSRAERIADEIVRDLTPASVGPFGRIVYYPMRSGALRTPLVRKPDEDVVFALNILRIPETAEKAEVDGAIAENRRLYERVRREGGVLYPVAAFPMSETDWRQHFGPAWPRLQEAKTRHDRNLTLTPGYAIF